MQYNDLTEDVMFVRWTVDDFIIGLLWLCLRAVCTLSQGSVSMHAKISSIFTPSPSPPPFSVSLFIFVSFHLVSSCLLLPHFFLITCLLSVLFVWFSLFFLSSHNFSFVHLYTRFFMLILNIALITYNGPYGLSQLTVIRRLSHTQLIKCLCQRSQETQDHAWHIISLWMSVIAWLPSSCRQTRRFARCKTNGKKETPWSQRSCTRTLRQIAMKNSVN